MVSDERKREAKRALVVYKLFNRANSSERTAWLEKAQKGYDFFLNEQLTSTEEKQLSSAGMPTFTINRMTPILEMMKYFITANSPRWKAVAVEGTDENLARIYQEIADYCWYISDGDSMFGSVVQGTLNLSQGWFFVDVDVNMDRGMGECVIRSIDTREVFVDPAAKDFMYRDAGYMGIRKAFTRTQLMSKLPQHKAKIQKARGNLDSLGLSNRGNTGSGPILPEDISLGSAYDPKTGEQEDFLDYYEMFQKVQIPYILATIQKQFPDMQLLELKNTVKTSIEEFQAEINIRLDERINELGKVLESGEIIKSRHDLEVIKVEKQAVVDVQEYTDVVTSRLKDKIENNVAIEILPKKEFETLFRTDPLFRESLKDYVEYFETLIKFTQSVGSDTILVDEFMDDRIHDYPLIPLPYIWTGTPFPISAASYMVGKQQEINKAHQIMLHHANLTANMKWLLEQGSVDDKYWEQNSTAPSARLYYNTGFATPVPVPPQNLNNAFYTITLEGKVDMEYTAGIQPITMGISQSNTEPFKGVLARDENSTRRIKAWIQTTLDPVLVHLGRVFLQVSQSVYTTHKIFRLTQPRAGDVNQKERKFEINIPQYDDKGEVISRWNDYPSARFDIRLVAGSTLPVNKEALEEKYFDWFKSNVIDDVAFWDMVGIEGREELAARMSYYTQLTSKNEQLESELKDKDGTIETLKRQVVQGDVHVDASRAGAEISKAVSETKAQQKLLRDELKLAVDVTIRELNKIVTETKKSIDFKKKSE